MDQRKQQAHRNERQSNIYLTMSPEGVSFERTEPNGFKIQVEFFLLNLPNEMLSFFLVFTPDMRLPR